MAITARMTTDLTWLNDAFSMFLEIPEAIAIAGGEAFNDAHDAFLQDLQEEPPPVNGRKIEWTSRLQQQAYFASNGFGGGIPSKRTGKLPAAWELVEEVTDNGWKVLVSNPAKASRFVYGSLAISNLARAARFQQKFHAITGWKLAAPIVLIWFDLLQEQFVINLNTLIGELGTPAFKQRGITPRLPKRKR